MSHPDEFVNWEASRTEDVRGTRKATTEADSRPASHQPDVLQGDRNYSS